MKVLLIRIGGVDSISPAFLEPSFGIDPIILMKSPPETNYSSIGSFIENLILKCSHSSSIWTCLKEFLTGDFVGDTDFLLLSSPLFLLMELILELIEAIDGEGEMRGSLEVSVKSGKTSTSAILLAPFSHVTASPPLQITYLYKK